MRRLFFTVFLFLLLSLNQSVHAGVVLLGSQFYNYSLDIGGVCEGSISLKNTGNTPETVRIYQSDYTFDAQGHSLNQEPGILPRSNEQWITISASKITINPDEQVKVAYSISVPSNSALIGSYWSRIYVEPESNVAPPQTLEVSGNKLVINQHIRYAVQVVTNIGETGKTSLSFKNAAVTLNKSGSYNLQVEMHNTGERYVQPNAWLELYDQTGTKCKTVNATKAILYPDTSTMQNFDLGSLKPGTYHALILADVGSNIFGTQYILTTSSL